MKTPDVTQLKSGRYRALTSFTFFTSTGPRPRIRQEIDRMRQQIPLFHFHYPRVDRSFINYLPHYRMSMSKKRVVRIEDRTDRWRFVCPRGHRSWEPTNHHFWCAKCARRRDVDGVFFQLVDRKTREKFERSEIRLVTPAGPYDQDIDRGVS